MDMINGMEYNVTVKNLVRHHDTAPETNTYKGFSLPSAKYDPPGTFRLSTGIREFPIRVIRRDLVVSINDRTVCFQSMLDEKQVRIVKGSKGEVYTVTTEHGRSSCTCVGFQFRRQCKHTEAK